MKYCVHCGNELLDDAVICPKCGCRVPNIKEEKKEETKKEETKNQDGFCLQYIGEKSVYSPTTAVFDAIQEMSRMGQLAVTNLERAMNALITLDEADIGEVYVVEKQIDFLNHEITSYLVKVNQTTLPAEDAKSIGGLFHIVNDIERIGDHAVNIAEWVIFSVTGVHKEAGV